MNAGRKPGHQLRMWQQSEPSGIFDRIMSAPITSPTLVAPVANLSPSPSVWLPASTETMSVSLISPVTSHFELNLRCKWSKKINRCRANFHETITQSDRSLLGLYGIYSWLDPKTGKEQSSDWPTSISRITS